MNKAIIVNRERLATVVGGALDTDLILGRLAEANLEYHDCLPDRDRGEVAPLSGASWWGLMVFSTLALLSDRSLYEVFEASSAGSPNESRSEGGLPSWYAVTLLSWSSNPTSLNMDLRSFFTIEKLGSVPEPTRSRSEVLCELNCGLVGGVNVPSNAVSEEQWGILDDIAGRRC